MKISGIYKIQSKTNPLRFYIGSSINISNRWVRHLWDLKKNIHSSSKLQRHFNKYGEADLQFSVLIECDKEDLIRHEQYFIDEHKPFFNTCKTAGNVLGIKRSEETKKKLSMANKGQIPYIKGKHRTPEEVARMRERRHTEESKAKMRERCKCRKPISEETRQRLRDSHKGQKPWNKGFSDVYSIEALNKMSASHLGMRYKNKLPVTKETRQKMRESGLKVWERKRKENQAIALCRR